MKRYLLIMRHSPFGNSKTLEGFELAVTLAAFAQPVSLLFIDMGVLCFYPDKDETKIGSKDFTTGIANYSSLDLKKIYVCTKSIKHFKIKPENLPKDINLASAQEITNLIAAYDVVLTI